MENIKLEFAINYYHVEVVDQSIVISNQFYDKNLFIFLFYLLIEFFDGPSKDFLLIPRKFHVSKQATYIRLSKNLELETDGSYEIFFREQDLKRWIFGIAFPIFFILLIFIYLLYHVIGFLIISGLSAASIILFVGILFMVSVLSYVNLILFKQYQEYKTWYEERLR